MLGSLEMGIPRLVIKLRPIKKHFKKRTARLPDHGLPDPKATYLPTHSLPIYDPDLPLFSERAIMNRYLSLIVILFLCWGCESSEPIIEHPESSPIMPYSVSEVTQVRSVHNVDQRAMAIEGVLSVGVTGNSNDDAWIQIQCQDSVAVERVRSELGDSLAGVPIKFKISDTIRAQK